MGNIPSAPGEQVMKAVEANKPYELAKLINALQHSPRGFNPRWLEWKDSCGRTPIIVCARENKTACAEVLLKAGCDVNYINCMQEQRGSALHEAAHKNYDAMVDLLMRYGGNPWIANVYGRTALHEAAIVKAAGPIFRFRHAALHTGIALVKQTKLGGLSNPYKPMVLLITPYFYCPRGINNTNIGRAAHRPPRKQLWFLNDDKVEEPKANVWLEGAVILEGPKETLLRLHPTHGQPRGDLHTRYDHGYCISLRPINYNPDTLHMFRSFLAECCAPSQLGPQTSYNPIPDDRTVHSTPDLSPSPQPAPPTPPPDGHDRHASTGETDDEFAARLATLFNDGTPPVSPQSHPTAVNADGAGDATNPSSPARPEGRSPQRSVSGGTPQRISATGTPAPSDTPTPPQHTYYPPIPSLSTTTEPAPALSPVPSAPVAAASHPAPTHPTPQATHSPLQPQPSDWAAPPSTRNNEDIARSTRPPSADAQLQAEQAEQQQLQRELQREQEQGQRQQQQLEQQLREQGQQGPTAASEQRQSGSGGGSGNRAVDAMLAVQPSHEEDEQLQCIICMEGPRECGFLHGASMHLCVCRECKKSIPPGSPCPLCRMHVERAIDVF